MNLTRNELTPDPPSIDPNAILCDMLQGFHEWVDFEDMDSPEFTFEVSVQDRGPVTGGVAGATLAMNHEGLEQKFRVLVTRMRS
ncbi:hypothetical protein CL91_gp72 [Mycobacterium phage Aeneas]|uniref:Uncharacterized protein n=3 Tax=Fromanvirus TaxID=186764 RepID=I3WX54_9CAUD|nr:hypothetical protein P756_gp69 [Mycobacterium phage PhrostyMug]YP_009016053.1 hypothetical protein CL67_gp67 [Mycobacterium phage Perseus]YP_009016337.1 hypothetical protein CL91_gp72 [Mycobacterium phage Aeneas]YP_009591814.1 hypothetical protein FDG62_gp074 [Mycobacterium phage Nepal]AGU92372.1 hypothetical protein SARGENTSHORTY9_72 [Mycobacterium phage SargentShorty9]ASZ74038.1 hypothetical protein SEA_SMAIRT_71 [Mycobacterium phage Smairt]QNL30924.1 hypothetical protein SEA_MULE_66 [My